MDRNQKIHNLYHWFQTEHETNRPLQHVETVEEVNCFWKSYGSELEQACDEYWADFSHELPTEDEGFGVSWVVLLASCFFLILFKNEVIAVLLGIVISISGLCVVIPIYTVCSYRITIKGLLRESRKIKAGRMVKNMSDKEAITFTNKFIDVQNKTEEEA